MPLARTVSSGAFQCAGVKSSLTIRFTLTPNTGPASAARAGDTPLSASAITARRTDLRTIVPRTLDGSAERPAQRRAGAAEAHRDEDEHRDVESGVREARAARGAARCAAAARVGCRAAAVRAAVAAVRAARAARGEHRHGALHRRVDRADVGECARRREGVRAALALVDRAGVPARAL